MNPADVISRGTTVRTLIESRWLAGPTWLKNKDDWPDSKLAVGEFEMDNEKFFHYKHGMAVKNLTQTKFHKCSKILINYFS